VSNDDAWLDAGDDLAVPLIAADSGNAIAVEISARARAEQSPLAQPPSSGRGIRVLLQSFLL